MHFTLLVTPRGPGQRGERRTPLRAPPLGWGATLGGTQRKGDGRMSLGEQVGSLVWGSSRGSTKEWAPRAKSCP